MKSPKLFVRLAVAALVAFVGGSSAQAGLLPVSTTVTPENENYRWTYAIVLPTDMKLQSGNYFTIYDFAGYKGGGETAPGGWTFTASKVGETPNNLNPSDSTDLWNLTWKYSGDTIPSGQIGLGNFWAISSIGNQTTASFTSETNRTSDGLVDRNITTTIVPANETVVNPPGVPEPATLAMAGLGLPLLGLGRVFRRRK